MAIGHHQASRSGAARGRPDRSASDGSRRGSRPWRPWRRAPAPSRCRRDRRPHRRPIRSDPGWPPSSPTSAPRGGTSTRGARDVRGGASPTRSPNTGSTRPRSAPRTSAEAASVQPPGPTSGARPGSAGAPRPSAGRPRSGRARAARSGRGCRPPPPRRRSGCPARRGAAGPAGAGSRRPCGRSAQSQPVASSMAWRASCQRRQRGVEPERGARGVQRGLELRAGRQQRRASGRPAPATPPPGPGRRRCASRRRSSASLGMIVRRCEASRQVSALTSNVGRASVRS